ncbi:uncharacterized protein LOC144351949 [Saccoglossus kowalevskii]
MDRCKCCRTICVVLLLLILTSQCIQAQQTRKITKTHHRTRCGGWVNSQHRPECMGGGIGILGKRTIDRQKAEEDFRYTLKESDVPTIVQRQPHYEIKQKVKSLLIRKIIEGILIEEGR